MVETNNLYEVAMGKVTNQYGKLDEAQSEYYTKGIAFQNEMNEKLATNRAELQQYQAMYYSMLKSQGIRKDKSYLMSESLTKAGYDIASLYNLSVEDAMSKLKSGLAGQVEPLRKIGVDISESALQKVVNNVGIDRSVQQLSYAEKEVARYIAIMQQAGQAQGDFAKTFESPANQARVFKNQLAELKQVAGSFIVNTFQPILVWANAIVMTIKEILKTFANLFGYDLDTSSSLGGVSDNVDDINTGLGNAIKKAKEFKKQILSFDELNNIEPPTKSGSSGSGAAGGLDSRLLDNLAEWDNKMSSISGKAQEIRDKMLEWLGFVRNDDGTWKLGEGLTNFEKIKDVVQIIGVALGTWKIASTITDFMKSFGIFGTGNKANQKAFQVAFGLTMTLTGIFAQYKGTKHMLEGNIDLFTLLETLLGTGAGAFGIASILKATKLGKQLGFTNSLKIGLGIMLAIQGVQILIDGLKNNDIRNQIVGALETGFGVGLAVTAFSGNIVAGLTVGIVVTAAIGLTAFIKDITDYGDSLGGLKERIKETKQKTEELTEKIKNNIDAYKNATDSIKNSADNKLLEIKSSEKLVEKLGDLVDANGNVIEGNEKRVDFILKDLSDAIGIELSRNDKVITKNGEVVKSYDDLKKSIEKVIEQKKQEIRIEAYSEEYKEAIKEEIKVKEDAKKAQENYNEALKNYEEFMKNGKNGRYDPWFDGQVQEWDKVKENLKQAEKNLNDVNQHYKEVTDNIQQYDSQLTQELIKQSGTVSDETIAKEKITSKTLQDMLKNSTAEWEKSYDSLKENNKTSMLALSTTLDTWSPKIESKWKEMAQNSASDFSEAISKVPPDVQSKILSALTTTEDLTPQVVQAWSNLAKSSEQDFTNALSKVEDSTQVEILKAVTKTEGLTYTTAQAWANLANKSEQSYKNALSGMSPDTSGQIQAIVSTLNGNQWAVGNAGGGLGASARTSFTNNLGNGSSSASYFVQGFINVINSMKNPYSGFLSSVAGLASKALQKFNSTLSIHSPSRETMKSAMFFAQGFALQIKKETPSLANNVGNFANELTDSFNENLNISGNLKEFSNGIKINTKDMAIDTNQYINYGTVRGQIQAQSNIALNDNIANRFAEASYEAFCRAMRDEGVNVNIEAKTEEGVIVKTVTEGFKEHVMQTGELPFPVPVG